MPIVDNKQIKGEESAPGISRKVIASKGTGATDATMYDLTLQPGAKIKLHTHPTDEVIFIHTGVLEATLGKEKKPISANQTLVATAGVPHGLLNNGNSPARIIAFFPTLDVQRKALED